MRRLEPAREITTQLLTTRELSAAEQVMRVESIDFETEPFAATGTRRVSDRVLKQPAAWVGPEVGSLIDGKYRVIGPLGQGGMGCVVLAVDERLQRDVAIKFIRPEYVSSDPARERFLMEARTMARIKHESVLEIYAFGEVGSSPYYVMEYVPGTNLAQWMDSALLAGRPPDVHEALALLDAICRGVEAMHQQGAVHGDLKPSNILMGPGLGVAIADMGLARALEARDSHALFAGTPAYMSPDFLRSELAPELLPRSDVFALGVIAYELFTGELPWEVASLHEMLKVYRAPGLRRPSELRPELPEALDAPLLAALEMEAERRMPSAEALRCAMLAAWQGATGGHQDLRVVVADGAERFQELACEILSRGLPGIRIERVRGGAEALSACEREAPALVLVDLDSPAARGAELTVALRQKMDVPVVVVTASSSAHQWQRLQSLGAAACLLKPVQPTALVALARGVLGRP